MTDQEPKQEKLTDEELVNQIREEFAKLTVKDFLSQTLFTLSTLAYQKMGVPAANELIKDLDQAKLAIDAYSNLYECLKPQLENTEQDSFKQILSRLQLDYVNMSKQG